MYTRGTNLYTLRSDFDTKGAIRAPLILRNYIYPGSVVNDRVILRILPILYNESVILDWAWDLNQFNFFRFLGAGQNPEVEFAEKIYYIKTGSRDVITHFSVPDDWMEVVGFEELAPDIFRDGGAQLFTIRHDTRDLGPNIYVIRDLFSRIYPGIIDGERVILSILPLLSEVRALFRWSRSLYEFNTFRFLIDVTDPDTKSNIDVRYARFTRRVLYKADTKGMIAYFSVPYDWMTMVDYKYITTTTPETLTR